MMRPLLQLILALLTTIAACSVCPASAQPDDMRITLRMDWTDNTSARADAISLVKRGWLPVPLIFVDGELRAMLEDGIAINLHGRRSASIDVGMVQFIERPLYSLRVEASSNLSWLYVQLTYPSLVQSLSKSSTDLSQPVLKIDKDNSQFLVPMREVNGSFSVHLPAEPYAAIAKFISDRKQGVELGQSLPVQPKSGGQNALGTADYMSQNKEKFAVYRNEDVMMRFTYYDPLADPEKKAGSGVVANLPAPYRDSLQGAWLTTTASFLDWFRADPLLPLLLKSIPPDAEIYISGGLQHERTNHKIAVMKRVWNTIFLKRDNNECQVDPSLVKEPAGPEQPYVFECELKAASP